MAYSHEQLERDIDHLLMREPFYGHFFQGLGRVLTRGVPTAGVTWNGEMYLLLANPDFFQGLNPQEKVAVLKHEVLHLVFRHVTRARGKVHHVYNIAADLVVNQLCPDLPSGALSIMDFQRYGLKPNGTADEYYETLIKWKETAAAENSGAEADGLEQCWLSGLGVMGSHQSWGETLKSPAQSEIAEWKAGDLALQSRERVQMSSSSQWGSMPRSVQMELRRIENERTPRICWKEKLRIFAAGSSRSSRIATMRRPSRRFGTHPGTRIKRESRLLVAIDTSGSTSDIREMFFAELRNIWAHQRDIWIVECDAKVGASYRFDGTIPTTITGGGGTSFEPVFEWMRSGEARSAPHRGQFDGCIYFTDGWGPALQQDPCCRILWVLPPPYTDYFEEQSWTWLTPGEVVHMSA